MVYERYYTVFNLLAIVLLSLGVYIGYQWFSNFMTYSYTYAIMDIVYSSPLYWFTVIVCVGAASLVDFFITSYNFNFRTTPSDYLRQIVKAGESYEENQDEFKRIYKERRDHYLRKDMKREEMLEQKREELAKLASQ